MSITFERYIGAILPEAEQHKQQDSIAMTVAEEPLFPGAFSALPVRSTHDAPTPTSTPHRTAVEGIS
jgi:hypothetical protein